MIWDEAVDAERDRQADVVRQEEPGVLAAAAGRVRLGVRGHRRHSAVWAAGMVGCAAAGWWWRRKDSSRASRLRSCNDPIVAGDAFTVSLRCGVGVCIVSTDTEEVGVQGS